MLRLVPTIVLLFMLVTASLFSLAQAPVRVSGRVFDMTQSTPLGAVSVLSNSGAGTVTDSAGRYSIVVPETDSIWFSYLGKPTPKYGVSGIRNFRNFEVALHVNVTELQKVTIKPPDYKLDSTQNRKDYGKIFNYQKPGFKTGVNPDGGVGVDLDELINVFRFRRNKSTAAFKERLLQDEQEKYIDYRFSRALVIKLTKLRGSDLDTFMVQYRPPLYLVKTATDYEFQLYIKNSYERYMKMKTIMGELRKEGE